jgi:hypothetical protein
LQGAGIAPDNAGKGGGTGQRRRMERVKAMAHNEKVFAVSICSAMFRLLESAILRMARMPISRAVSKSGCSMGSASSAPNVQRKNWTI